MPYTNPALTARALAAAAELARGFEAAVTLMAVHVLPYPSPLECQEGIRKRLEAELTAVARTSPVAIRVKLVFARDREDAYLGLLRPPVAGGDRHEGSLVENARGTLGAQANRARPQRGCRKGEIRICWICFSC